MDLSSCLFPVFISHEIERAQEGSLEESYKKFVIQKETEVIFNYGQVSSIVLDQLVKWLESATNHFVYFILKTPSEAKGLLKSLKENPKLMRIKICLEDHLNEALLTHMGWQVVFKPFETLTLQDSTDEKFLIFRERLISVLYNITAIASAAKEFNKQIYSNTLQNIKNLKSFRFLVDIKDSLKGLPAIICGAGESLLLDAKALSIAEDKAVVFSGGSALRILSDLQIFFNLAVAIDPNPLIERFKKVSSFEVPWVFLFRNASFFSKLFNGEGIVAFEEENFLEKDIFSDLNMRHKGFDYGWNVGNFQAFVAAYLGCGPIFMTGMDMGFTENEYALELEEENKAHEEFQDFTNIKKFQSRKDLFLSKEYFEKIPLGFSQTKFYQSSNSRLCPKGFTRLDLSSFLENLPSCDISARVHQMINHKNKNYELSGYIDDYIAFLKRDMAKAIKIFQEIKKVCQVLQDKGIPSKSFREEYLALEEFELESLKTYKVLLQPAWDIWKHLLYRDLKDEESSLEKTLHKYVFFQRVVEEFTHIINKDLQSEPSDEKRIV